MTTHRFFRCRPLRWPCAVMIAATLLPCGALTGCDDPQSDVRVYTARIDPPTPPMIGQVQASAPAAKPAPLQTDTNAGVATPRELAWDVPTDSGFRDTGEANQFRLTTLRAGNPDDPANALEVSISRIGGPAGTITGNVNRWRQQLGLPPLEQKQVVPLVDYAPNETVPGFFTRIEAPDGNAATMIAWFQLEHASWFFKANGTPAALDTHREGFDALVASVRRNPQSPSDPHTDHDRQAQPLAAPPPAPGD
ncbi:MAG: hypothetical protein AAF328_11115 [Planctomycetota bacterium]